MRTTLTLEDEVAIGIKSIQKKRPNASFKQIVNDIMKKGLAVDGEAAKVPFKIRPMKNAKPRRGLNFDNVWDLLSEVEGDFYK
ncbi:MAG: hypothetical protein AB7F88_11345 [Pyrinomonadaceae bacterium]